MVIGNCHNRSITGWVKLEGDLIGLTAAGAGTGVTVNLLIDWFVADMLDLYVALDLHWHLDGLLHRLVGSGVDGLLEVPVR